MWGALWALPTGEPPDWLADHQPSRIRRRLLSLRPSGLLWAVRYRSDIHRFRASAPVLKALRPFLRISGVAGGPGTDQQRLEGYVTPDRFEWMKEGFPIVQDESGGLVLRVSEFTARVEHDTMPIAFVAADMAGSDDTSDRMWTASH